MTPQAIPLAGIPSEALRQALIKSRARDDLHTFLRYYAWPVLNPATPFADNWHIHAICEHLMALEKGEISKLLINMPFRMLKSTIVSQAFPAWVWLRKPSTQFLTASYARDVAVRDAVDARRIIESPNYQRDFGHLFRMTSDQNVKSRYENSCKGTRIVTSTDGAGTGFGGDIRIVDDPVSAKEADSEVALRHSVEWWRGTMATRANDPSTGRAVVVHQRLNVKDLTGYLLANELGWEHLVLPFRYDPALRKTTSLGFTDPRTVEGELIHPARLPEAKAKELEASVGSYHKSAQLQQNPEPRGGIIFKREHWKYYTALPSIAEYVMSVDCTFKDQETSDFVAIQVWGSAGANDYLLYRLKERMGFAATVQATRTVRAKFPRVNAVLIEDKANGSAVIETLRSEIAGIIPVTPDGGKIARAYAAQPAQEAGNVWIPDPAVDPDIETFLTEASAFPNAPNDDEVDAMTQYLNWRRTRGDAMGLFNLMREQYAEQQTAKGGKMPWEI